MAHHVTGLVLLSLWCASSGLAWDETSEVVYIPVRSPRKTPITIEPMPRNPYHPLVRFRTIDVRPAYFYVLDKSPENYEVKLTPRELADILRSLYEDIYHEPPSPMHNNIVRFGIIR